MKALIVPNTMVSTTLTRKRPILSARMRRHLDDLGFESPIRYRLWCHRQGLDSGLDKGDDQLADEIDRITALGLNDPCIVSTHTPHRARLITQIYNGDLDGVPLTDRLTRVRNQFHLLSDNSDDAKAFHELVLNLEKYSRLLTGRFGFPGVGDGEHNTIIGGLGQLARSHRGWIRPTRRGDPPARACRDSSGNSRDIWLQNITLRPVSIQSGSMAAEMTFGDSRRGTDTSVVVGI